MTSESKQFDRAMRIFASMNEFLPPETIGGLKAALSGKIDKREFGWKVGPVNLERWERDIDVIVNTLEVMEMGLA